MWEDNFDITFCKGEVKHLEGDTEVTTFCPVREKCHRYWTEKHSKRALETGDIYHSFFVMDDLSFIKENGCDSFWEEK